MTIYKYVYNTASIYIYTVYIKMYQASQSVPFFFNPNFLANAERWEFSTASLAVVNRWKPASDPTAIGNDALSGWAT